MKINVHLGKNTFLVTLNDSPAAAALYRQLPVTIKFGDLFSREKHGELPDSLPEEGPRTFTYKVGDLAYWSPSGDIAFYYRDDGQKIPSPGVIMLGQANPKDMSLLDVTGPVDLTLEKAK
ncbi:cyclophilin-like fold protein [Erwinia sp.]|uniref:cyclophilin-like fold protein n=1 Tax=Erwinia citreus TaxID=558 RepID=UPI003C782831